MTKLVQTVAKHLPREKLGISAHLEGLVWDDLTLAVDTEVWYGVRFEVQTRLGFELLLATEWK